MERDLSSEIDARKDLAKLIRNMAAPGKEDEVESSYFEKEFEELIHYDFMHVNPDNMMKVYSKYFKEKKLPTITIKKGDFFYRARIGYNTVPLAEDDFSKDFIIPYYKNEIGAPPPVLAVGGRFNREGTSYLYLADDIETCLAEVHLQVGQKCSVSRFVCTHNLKLLDLTKFNDDIEMQAWLNILTQPIHSSISYKYNITRFLADVFKKINNKGIYFKSIQSYGNNIVCFDPESFSPVEYSSKIYTASKITYQFDLVKDSVNEYIEKDTRAINSYNEAREFELENRLEYFEKWVEYRREHEE